MAPHRQPGFRGRASECQVLDGLLESVRGGQSAALVIRGEAGVGKTALLRYAAGQASEFRVVQLAGVEAEMELPFAGLHQLCAPVVDQLPALPGPQQDALRVAFGLSFGAAPDPFLVGLGTLSLLSEAAAERPLVCFVDDAQWLDAATRQVLGFVARRLLAESVGVIFAVRQPSDEGGPTNERELVRLPELLLTGLNEDDAGAPPGQLEPRRHCFGHRRSGLHPHLGDRLPHRPAQDRRTDTRGTG
jgi:AAA ATPase domain